MGSLPSVLRNFDLFDYELAYMVANHECFVSITFVCHAVPSVTQFNLFRMIHLLKNGMSQFGFFFGAVLVNCLSLHLVIFV